jgi:hypothetical protein
VDELSPRFEAIALDNLVAAGEIRECDRKRVRFMRRVLAYPPEREGEHVRPLLRQWQERQAAAKAAQCDEMPSSRLLGTLSTAR